MNKEENLDKGHFSDLYEIYPRSSLLLYSAHINAVFIKETLMKTFICDYFGLLKICHVSCRFDLFRVIWLQSGIQQEIALLVD